MSDLTNLIERCKDATGPDREIDAQIRWHVTAELQALGSVAQWLATDAADSGAVPKYTSSIDAIVGLIEREMPGANWLVENYGGECAAVLRDRMTSQTWAIPNAGNYALALCWVFLSAKAAISKAAEGEG